MLHAVVPLASVDGSKVEPSAISLKNPRAICLGKKSKSPLEKSEGVTSQRRVSYLGNHLCHHWSQKIYTHETLQTPSHAFASTRHTYAFTKAASGACTGLSSETAFSCAHLLRAWGGDIGAARDACQTVQPLLPTSISSSAGITCGLGEGSEVHRLGRTREGFSMHAATGMPLC